MMKGVAMIGNDYVIAKMRKELNQIDINLEKRDYQALEDILIEMQNAVIDIIFLAEDAIFSADIIEHDSKERLKQAVLLLREKDEAVKIVVFCNTHKQDLELEDWCRSKKVYDIFYPDIEGQYRLTQIVNTLKKSSLKEKKVEYREKIVHIPVIEEKNIEKEIVKEVIVEKPVYIQTGANDLNFMPMPAKLSALQIGVFNLSHGAGATHISVLLAQGAATCGYKTAVIGCDGKPDLSYRKKDKLKVIVAEQDKVESEIIKLNKESYNIIVLDFGNIIKITETGVTANEILLDKLLKIQHRVGVGFSAEWHLPALEYYANNYDHDDFIFMIDHAESVLRRYKDLNICDRNDTDVILQYFGIKNDKEKYVR